MSQAQIEAVMRRLREGGGRVTAPRRAIVAALLGGRSQHVTAEELTARVQAANPEVNQSTVYRTLDTLEGLGVIDHVHLAHGPAVYHLVEDAHQHLVCDSCGLVVELPVGFTRKLVERLQKEFDFTLHARHFALSGRCATCTAAAADQDRGATVALAAGGGRPR